MTKEKNKLIPRLRFPEFLNGEEWKLNKLGNIYSFITTNSFSRDDLNYINGKVKNIHYGDIHTKFSILFDITKENVPFINESIPLVKFKDENYCKERDIIFADASEDLKDIGKSIELVNLNKEKLFSGLHTLLARQINYEIVAGFGGYLFLNHQIRKQIQRESQGAKVLGISATRLSNINIFYPQKTKEQQKIASCLSSLDEVITAENQKLDLLKHHKKGLLQNLFPQEGETVPKYRFKEYENSGEWEVKVLADVASFVNNKTSIENLSINSYISTENLLPDYSGVALSSKLPSSGNFNIYRKGDVLISNIRPYLKKVWFADKDGACSNDVIVIHAHSIIIDAFLSYLLKNDAFINYIMKGVEGVKMPRGDKDLIRAYPITFPINKTEQQKIVDTLSSIDEFITDQSQKIEALKQHKKGLLQGLFPKIEA